ncbi:hypothetical protein BDZ88DRAFT_417513 [Geranomyces variabilis]|nr:hypothetical protein BDZ88DRAFT_417513 [Geranomyces variabilis]
MDTDYACNQADTSLSTKMRPGSTFAASHSENAAKMATHLEGIRLALDGVSDEVSSLLGTTNVRNSSPSPVPPLRRGVSSTRRPDAHSDTTQYHPTSASPVRRLTPSSTRSRSRSPGSVQVVGLPHLEDELKQMVKTYMADLDASLSNAAETLRAARGNDSAKQRAPARPAVSAAVSRPRPSAKLTAKPRSAVLPTQMTSSRRAWR